MSLISFGPENVRSDRGLKWNDARILNFLAVLMGKPETEITEVDVAKFSFTVSSIADVETESDKEIAANLRRAAHTILQRQGDPMLQEIAENEQKISTMKIPMNLALRVMFIVDCARKEKISVHRAVDEINHLTSKAKEGFPKLKFEAFVSLSDVETRPDAEKMYESFSSYIERKSTMMSEALARKENEFAQSIVNLTMELMPGFSERFRVTARMDGFPLLRKKSDMKHMFRGMKLQKNNLKELFGHHETPDEGLQTEEDIISAAKYSDEADALFVMPKSIIFKHFWNDYELRRGPKKMF